jgi:O-antigen/teichoic acid export membrane protein
LAEYDDSRSVGKNVWYTSISLLIPSVFTYLFWFVTARLVGAEPIGVASSIAAIVDIIATISVFDVSLGMKRSLGLAVASGDFGRFKQVLTSTVAFVCITLIITSILLAIPKLGIVQALGFDWQYTWIIIAAIIAMSFRYIFSEALIASLDSKKLVMPFLLGSLIRFPILFIAVSFFSLPTLGTVIAYCSLIFISAIYFGIYSIKVFRGRTNQRALGNIYLNVKHVLHAGLASWIPHIMNVLGTQFGIITVVTTLGASEGGKFYIAMGTFLVTLFIVTGISKVTHSMIGSLQEIEERKNFISYSIKIAFIFTMPLTMPLLFFSDKFLGLMGSVFGSAGSILSILMTSLPFVIISEMIYYFYYGMGNHKEVLYLGLGGNIPRIILYVVLSPLFGSNGTAIAWLVGSVAQMVLSIMVARRNSLALQFRQYAILVAIPVLIGLLTWSINLNFLISTVAIFFCSFFFYIKVHLFTDVELRGLLYNGLPNAKAKQIYPILSKVMHVIR